MDDETRVGFLPPIALNQRDVDEERFSRSNINSSFHNRKIETIVHYCMVIILFLIIGFYVFFITTIVFDKYSTNSINLHIDFPYAKDYERNKFLYKKAECLTICNLNNEPFEILFSLNKKSKIKSYKPVIIESSTDSQLSCITTAKKKGNYTPEIINRFKFNKSSDLKIKVNELANIGKNQQFNNNEITHSSISIFTHKYREALNIKKIQHNSLNINYNNTNTYIVLKKYNENSFTLALKEDNSTIEEEISIDNLFSILNNNGDLIDQYM